MMQNDNKRARGNVDEEVQKLFRKQKVSPTDFQRLRQRYDDVDLADQIQNAYIEKHTKIMKRAKKFAQLIRNKYSDTQYPFHILLEKARLFKVKHGLSDDEFAEFQRIYEQELIGVRSNEVLQPSTNMTKVLGTMNVEYQGFATKLNENDYKTLQEILKIHASTRTLHSQVLLQSMQYEDCGREALKGIYHRELGHRVGDHVHPVVAAMFLPKIQKLESHFLHSNLAGVIKSRFNGEPLTNRPDYELFYSLTTDPNDVVCDNRSPVSDLLNRVQLQVQLWNSVLNLRNGSYYNPSSREFVATVDMCRLNKNDTPDLIYGRYDGTIIKRLLAAFSFRPTVVTTSPVLQNLVAMNPYSQPLTRPVVTAVPMINLRLAPNPNLNEAVTLKDAVSQQQFFLENGVLNARYTNIIYSNGVIFFFVDRRSHVIKFNDMPHLSLTRMPLAISGFERINETPVYYDPELYISGDVSYRLRSVVIAEVNRNAGGNVASNLVVGSSTLVMIHPTQANMARGISSVECFKYDPIGVVTPSYDPTNNTYSSNSPIIEIPDDNNVADNELSFSHLATTRGLVFMYEQSDPREDNEIVISY
jgi:hypothetical protein